MKMNNRLKIRKARLSDANAIYWLRRKTFEKINGETYSKEQIEFLNIKNNKEKIKSRIKNKSFFCLVNKNKLLGTIYLENETIGGLYIKWNKIKRGYGGLLMNFIEDYAKKKGLKKVNLRSTLTSINFYNKLGYKIIRKYTQIREGVKFRNTEMYKILK